MLTIDTESTICAISTGSEPALRGALRITGPDAIKIAASCLADQSKVSLIQAVLRPTRFESSFDTGIFGKVHASFYIWPDTRSYTGQPSVEIHTLGAPILLDAMQSKLIESGARLAQPGEFTLRAFLAGRLDLTQCEAVLGVIHASNEHSLNVALQQLSGGLTEPLKRIKMDLVHLMADIEAGLDFVDEDISFVSQHEIQTRLQAGIFAVGDVIEKMKTRAGQQHTLQIALVGFPNAGKSSLINALSQRNASIVSNIPGTTRDYVRTRIDLSGYPVDLIDTAGIEVSSDDSPRSLAQIFTREQIEHADLVLHCIPAHESSERIKAEFDSLRSQLNSASDCWTVLTKSDLTAANTEPSHASTKSCEEAEVRVSCFDLKSIDLLRAKMETWVYSRLESHSDAVPMTSQRCWHSLQLTLVALRSAYAACEEHRGDEVIASEIRIALDELGMIAGTVYTEDILDALFSRFCIGK